MSSKPTKTERTESRQDNGTDATSLKFVFTHWGAETWIKETIGNNQTS
jgi:hypothetical protein